MLAIRPVLSTLATMMILNAAMVCGQNYPAKPIHILTGSPGGSNDISARLIAGGISGPLGQPVIVENKGSSVITAPLVAKAPPDGYTIFLGGDVIWVGPLLQGIQPDPGFLSPITMLASTPNILAVHPSLPVKSVKELIALAKARPGELNYSSSTSGSAPHLSGALFNSMAGVNIVAIPYKGTLESVNAVLGGQVHLTYNGVSVVAPHVKAGRLRGLAVTSPQPSALMPGLPTVAASGLPGYEMIGVDAMFAPPKTPPAIINQLNREIVRYLKTPEVQDKYLSMGTDVVASSPEEHMARTKAFIASIGKVVKEAGIRFE